MRIKRGRLIIRTLAGESHPCEADVKPDVGTEDSATLPAFRKNSFIWTGMTAAVSDLFVGWNTMEPGSLGALPSTNTVPLHDNLLPDFREAEHHCFHASPFTFPSSGCRGGQSQPPNPFQNGPEQLSRRRHFRHPGVRELDSRLQNELNPACAGEPRRSEFFLIDSNRPAWEHASQHDCRDLCRRADVNLTSKWTQIHIALKYQEREPAERRRHPGSPAARSRP